MDLTIFIEQQRNLAMTLNPGNGFDHDPFQIFRMGCCL